MKRQLTTALALIMVASTGFAQIRAKPKFELRDKDKETRGAGEKSAQTHENDKKVETARMVEIGKLASSLGVSSKGLEAFSQPSVKYTIQMNEVVAKGQPKSTRALEVRGEDLVNKSLELNKKFSSAPAGSVIPARVEGARQLTGLIAELGDKFATGAAPGEGRSDEEVHATNSGLVKFFRDFQNALDNPPELTPGNAESEKAYAEYQTSLDNYTAYAKHMRETLQKSPNMRAHQVYIELDKYDAGARQRQADCEG
jgi:hypothetical protein